MVFALFSAALLAVLHPGWPLTDPKMSASEAAVTNLMKASDPLLLWVRQLLPERRRASASALYAWCRRLDEIVDAPAASVTRCKKSQQLSDWAQRLDELWAGAPRDDLDAALTLTIRREPALMRKPFDAMLAGMRMDATSESLRFEHFREKANSETSLLTYCYRVAGTVGEMLLPVLGLDGCDVRDEAIALGCAIQLLNIMRDCADDLNTRGRLYLPLADAARVGLSEADLERIIRSREPTAEYQRLLRLQGRRAAVLLARAEQSLPKLPSTATAVAVAVLIELHRALLQQMRDSSYDNLRAQAVGARRLRVSSVWKVVITARTAARVLWQRVTVSAFA
jgi:15-cis-phytoene synthase